MRFGTSCKLAPIKEKTLNFNYYALDRKFIC